MSVDAKIEGGEIVIRIPLTAMPIAADIAWDQEYGEDHGLFIDDPEEFAKEFVLALLSENEVGDTLLHPALDKAIINMTENGAFGIGDQNETV